MITTRVAFVVYGVHKDGLADPMGSPFIDEQIVKMSCKALESAGLDVHRHDLVIASRDEAMSCLGALKKRDDIDALVLFAGTWVWAAHLIAALRDFSSSGKAIVVWTHPGSQGWRPVGGLVLQGALKEVGIVHRFVYGGHQEAGEVEKITSYCRASALKGRLNMSVVGTFGGRGMGQTCGAADPSQWMRMFGIDIDSRDTTELLDLANRVSESELEDARQQIQPLFAELIPTDEQANRSIRLYLAIRKLMKSNAWDFYTIQSFPGLGDQFSASCFAQSIMLEDGVGTSTLGDFNTLLTVICLTELSREPVYYGDLQHIDKKKREIKIIGDGACPPSLAGEAGPAGFAEHGIPTEGEAGGLSVKLVCKPGEGVLARLGRREGQFEMLITRCSVFEPEAEVLQARKEECGIPFWPHAFVKLNCDMDLLVQDWNNEYACLGYGDHLYEELIAFCELSGIKAIAL